MGTKLLRRLLLYIMAFAVLLPVSRVQAAGDLIEIAAAHWSDSAVEFCRTYGILSGNDAGFDPDAKITREEYVQMVNRAFSFSNVAGARRFNDVDYAGAYGDDMLIASAMGYLLGYGSNAGPKDNLTREQAVTILARIYALNGSESAATKFSDDKDLSDWARGSLNAMISANYVKGDGNLLAPKRLLTKGETAQMLMNMLVKIADTDLSVGSSTNLTVRKDGIEVSNMTLSGDLFVTDGVGSGKAAFVNMAIAGRALIAGGGMRTDSLQFTDCGLTELVMNSKRKTHVTLSETSVKEILFIKTGRVTIGAASAEYDEDSGTLHMIGAFTDISEKDDGSITANVDGQTVTIRIAGLFNELVDETAMYTPPQVPTPTVTSVVVSPNMIDLGRGNTRQFTAAVIGTNNPSQAVTWELLLATASSVSANGLVNVVAAETSQLMVLRATSTADPTVSGTAVVFVPSLSVTYCRDATGVTTYTVSDLTVSAHSALQFAVTGFALPVDSTFKEWNTKADGSGTSYAENEVIDLTEDLVLYATYDVNPVAGNSPTNPILIHNQAELDGIRHGLDKHYRIVNDIILNGNWTPIGDATSTTSVDPFTGTLDGGGYTVSRLQISAGTLNAGLFAEIGVGGTERPCARESGYQHQRRRYAGRRHSDGEQRYDTQLLY